MDAMASQITSLTIVLVKSLFRRRSKKTSKRRVTGLCVGSSPVTGEFPAQMASNAENVSIWWRHHVITTSLGATSNDNVGIMANLGFRCERIVQLSLGLGQWVSRTQKLYIFYVAECIM